MKPIIVWFRQDLRLSDNPALVFAAKSGRPVVCLYVLDDETPGDWRWGGAARWWLHHSLTALDKALGRHDGGGLVLRRGLANKVLKSVARETGAEAVSWNRCYEPYAVARDKKLKMELTREGITVESFNAALLFEPWEICTKEGKPFRVFTPFWKALREKTEPGKPRPAPGKFIFQQQIKSDDLRDWALLPVKPDWAKDFDWTPGEAAAHQTLLSFRHDIVDYSRARDIPGLDGTSRLSPHLSWGEIGPRQVWHAVKADAQSEGAQTFLRELGWREF
ncbi:MAG TPA: deoxyribodipyrimidine photo-lyase, partial [Verrucomicrobiae bacterium]|nr:deoxyribodipyrimidine photo-lyase [Verrucomicrobiae bacterium]